MLAKVTLKEALSLAIGGRRFMRGKPQVLSDPREIAALQSDSAFEVALLPEPERQAAKTEPQPEIEPAEASTKKPASRSKPAKSAKSRSASTKKGR